MNRCGEFSWGQRALDPAARLEVFAWDGRLDNRTDLRWRFSQPPHGETSDASLVLAAYERHGVSGLRDIIGDWSVVLCDTRDDAVVLASDFAGVRPLYYCWQPGRVCWSRRLASLVEATGAGALDDAYIAGFLTRGGAPHRTPYAGIFSVPPGHAVRVTATGVSAHPFWTLPIGDQVRYRDERRYDEQLRALFREAVAARLQTDRPVVAELSGGLDSSSVVCMASDLIRRGDVPAPRMTTVSYVYGDSRDLPFIREVETLCGGEHVHLSTHETPLVSEGQVGTALPTGWEPLQRSVSAVARERGAQVLLTGQNGDLVTGNWFDDSLQVAALLRRCHVGAACEQALAWSRLLRVPVAWILSRALRALWSPSRASRDLYSLEGIGAAEQADTSLTPAFVERTSDDDSRPACSDQWTQAPPERRKYLFALTRLQELRVLQSPEAVGDLDHTHPFAHRPLVEFLMSVPSDILCRPGQPRRLMRRALADLWPPKLRARRSKSLFGAPWHDALRPLALALLAAPQLQVVERGWVDPASFAARLTRLVHGLDCNEPQLRHIILLEYWLRQRGRDRESSSSLTHSSHTEKEHRHEFQACCA